MLIENFAKLSRSSRSLLSACLITVVAIIMYRSVVAPHAAQVFAARRYDMLLDDVADKNKIARQAVMTKTKELEKLRQQFTELQSTLLTTSKAKEFFSDLQAIADQTNCAVNSLNFTTNKSPAKDKHIEDTLGIVAKSAILGVNGAYGNIIKLLERLQGRTQKVWIDSLTMKALGRNADQLKCEMTITIHTIPDKEIAVHE